MSQLELLFGELARSSITAHSAFLQRAAAESGRDRKTTSDLAFGAYLVARSIDALLDFDDTPDALTGLQWQIDATACYVRELPAEAETNHLTGLVEAITPDRSRWPALAISLTAYAYFLEHVGRFEEALSGLALSARLHGAELPPAEIASYGLFAARLNRILARWEQASVCYWLAEDAARSYGDFSLALRGRLGQGAVARGQGNLPKARAVAEEVVQVAIDRCLPQIQCLAYADLSAVLSLQGRPLEAIRACYAAFLVATTPLDRMQALGNLGVGLAEIGAYDQARLALEIVANAKTEFRIRANAVIELMELESIVGNRLAFERHRTTAADCREQMTPSMLVDYYFKLGRGTARFGHPARAHAILVRARELAEAHALNAWYFRVEHALEELAISRTVDADAAAPAELKRAPLVREVELGLREFAAAALG